MISITAFGRVPRGRMIHRAGAKPGDRVVVTGTIGDAVLGLDILKGGAAAAALSGDAAAREMLTGRYRVPQPRIALATAVRDHAHAAMDVSDGLAGDLAKLWPRPAFRRDRCTRRPAVARRRQVGGARRRALALIAGGDDMRFFCAIPEDRRGGAAARQAEVAVTSIGTMIAGASTPSFLDAAGNLC
jgi:thiamine-monophosphate kinase